MQKLTYSIWYKILSPISESMDHWLEGLRNHRKCSICGECSSVIFPKRSRCFLNAVYEILLIALFAFSWCSSWARLLGSLSFVIWKGYGLWAAAGMSFTTILYHSYRRHVHSEIKQDILCLEAHMLGIICLCLCSRIMDSAILSRQVGIQPRTK